jgi:hypothetical protein
VCKCWVRFPPYKLKFWSYATALSLSTVCMDVFCFCLMSADSRSSTVRTSKGGEGSVQFSDSVRVGLAPKNADSPLARGKKSKLCDCVAKENCERAVGEGGPCPVE